MCLRREGVIALIYLAADLVLNHLILGSDGWQVFWPLNGVTIALLLVRPRQQWLPFVFLIQAATACGEYFSDDSVREVLLDGVSDTLEVLIAASVLPAFTELETWLREPRVYPRFLVATLLAPFLTSVPVAAGALLDPNSESFTTVLLNVFPGEVIGVAAMVPLVLALYGTPPISFRQRAWWSRVLLAIGGTVIVMIGMFTNDHYPVLFVLYPFLVWIESVTGLLGSSIALCCASILAAALTQMGYGPFAHEFPPGLYRNVAVEFYLAFHLIFFLPVSVMSMERRRLMRELKEALKQATTLASVDALTGLANRRTFDTRLREQWELALRNRTSLGLLMIDVDHFKAFNDRLGHPAGDDCLRSVAGALARNVSRPTDLVARFGGEEFVVLLPDTSLDGVSHVAEILRAAVYSLALEHPGAPAAPDAARVTVSIGFSAIVPGPADRSKDLLDCADAALYVAKQSGRNRACSGDERGAAKGPRPALTKLKQRIKDLAYRSATPPRN